MTSTNMTTDDADRYVDQLVYETSSIFEKVMGDEGYIAFSDRVLHILMQHVQTESKVVDAPFVFPTKGALSHFRYELADVVKTLEKRYPDHARHVESAVLALMIDRIKYPTFIGMYIKHVSSDSAEYGIRDRLIMMQRADERTIKEAEWPRTSDTCPLMNLIEALAFLSTLREYSSIVEEQWPAPAGWGFLSRQSAETGGFRPMFELKACHDKLETTGCGTAMTHPTSGIAFIKSMLQVPESTDKAVASALACIRNEEARNDITAVLLKNGSVQVQLIMNGLSQKEWLIAVLSLRQTRSRLTNAIIDEAEYSGDAEGIATYAKHMVEMEIKQKVSGLFNTDTEKTLNASALSSMIMSEHAFMNNAFDETSYELSNRFNSALGKKKRRSVCAGGLCSQHFRLDLIKTRVTQLVRVKAKRNESVTFDPSGIEYITGEWHTPMDLTKCSKDVRDEYVMAYMMWMEIHRMNHSVPSSFRLTDFAEANKMTFDVIDLVED